MTEQVRVDWNRMHSDGLRVIASPRGTDIPLRVGQRVVATDPHEDMDCDGVVDLIRPDYVLILCDWNTKRGKGWT